jgi:hypothetical protein
MTSAYVRLDYSSIERPFTIEGRDAHCGGTEYWTIARLSETDARLLVQEGLPWRNGEPDWDKHYHTIERMKAERDKKIAERRLAELDAKDIT